MMSTNKLVTVIIPTFNRAYVLKRAVESVLNQTYKNFELIVVDDGSTDETSSLLANYPELIVIKTFNKGVSAARNEGIKASRGEWIALLDSDDEWHSNKLEVQMSYIDNNPKALLVHSDELWFRNNKRVNPKKIHKKSGGDIFERSLHLCLISPSAVVLKKSLLVEMNFFDESFTVCEDYDLWLKICSKYEVDFINQALINKYGGHEDQLSAKYFAMDYFRVKSMSNLLNSLSGSKLISTHEVIAKKSQILIAGYKKHNNLDNLLEVTKILENSAQALGLKLDLD